MSWFDGKGLASLAKTALKEAQSRIDKALDIQEETSSTTTIPKNSEKTTKTTKLVQTEDKKISSSAAVADSATWGSFTGSFFDNPNAHEMVTVPPKGNTVTPTTDGVVKTSDSVELLSSSTPCSSAVDDLEAISGSAADGNNSEDSIDLITVPSTKTSEELATPASGSSLHDSSSIAVISTKTVERNSISDENAAKHDDALSSGCDREIGILSSMNMNADTDPTNSSFKLLISMQDVPYEMQSVDSDSTQSFEDVQMQSCVIIPDCSSSSSVQDPQLQLDQDHPSDNDKLKNYSSPPNSNSNDEMETTSSDIEIISNPNGDSSSANSTTRPSPSLKTKQLTTNQCQNETTATTKKGHYREPSEISVLSEDSQSELDKLLHRIGELNEMLATRDLQKAALQDRNNELQILVESMKSNITSLDSAEEYTQRLSALEKKFQASIRERDALRIELQNKIPRDDLTQVVAESNAMITELRSEGEKLSKEILQQSNILKKVRAKEKSSEGLLKKNKDQIASMQDELDRLKKTLNAKEDVERSQIEAVHKMSSEKRKLEEENAQSRSKLEDLQSKLTTLQNSFDAVKVELQQRSRLHSDLTRTTEEALVAKKEKEATAEQNQEMLLQLNEIREKLRYSEHIMAKREQQLREENRQLLARLEAAEIRAENSKADENLTTIPLYRQLEALQNLLSQRTSNWNKEEKILLEKLDAAHSQLKCLENVEVTFKEKNNLLQERCMKLEEKLSKSLMEEEKAKIALQQTQLEYSVKEASQNRQITTLNNTLMECESKIKFVEDLNKSLKETASQKSVVVKEGAIHPSSDFFQPRQFSTDLTHDEDLQPCDQQRAHSPVLSLGAQTLEEEMVGSIDWQASDFDCISNPDRHGNTLDYGLHLNFMSGHNATTLEHLQSLLKQRDGEVSLLQWEISRLKAERDVLNEEISHITLELENAKERLQSLETLNNSFSELQHRYDELLQMFGEKVERTEELELDLIELKEAYKLQIDELLAKPPPKTTT